MSSEQIAARQEAIVDFAEIGQFLDTAVKFYSSGMFLRLAFSVAIHLDNDILLVDEVLAVGDGAFQIKCHDRILEAVAAGRTVVLVSHGLDTVTELCDVALVLNGGAVSYSGPATEAIDFYTHDILGIDGHHHLTP
jgi:ABC-2 type transport system ATP-binding protein